MVRQQKFVELNLVQVEKWSFTYGKLPDLEMDLE